MPLRRDDPGWQGLRAGDRSTIAAPERNDLHVWWWPEALQPAAESRRERTDRVLRCVLARYVGLAPAALAFGRESKGRPFLRHPGAPDFNLSDTHGGSLIAVCGSGRVGVDLERVDRQPPVHRLAKRWYAADEADALAVMDGESARLAFLWLWTAKEAACKATGTGIYGRLDAWRFAVGEWRPRVLALPEEAGSAHAWNFLRLAPSPEHTAVLACQGLAPVLQRFAIVPD